MILCHSSEQFEVMELLYIIQSDASRSNKYAFKDLSFQGYKECICESCGRHISIEQYDGECRELLLEGGKRYPDLLQFCGAGKRLFVVSETMMTLFIQRGVTGYCSVDPVLIRDTTRTRSITAYSPNKYYSLIISGEVDLDFRAMELRKKRMCKDCKQFDWNKKRFPAIVVDESSWDGSDLCIISSLPGYYVCSPKVASIIEEAKLSGIELIKNSKSEDGA